MRAFPRPAVLMVSAEDPRNPVHGGQQCSRSTALALSGECDLRVLAFSKTATAPVETELAEGIPLLVLPRVAREKAVWKVHLPLQMAQRKVVRGLHRRARAFGGQPDLVLCDALYAWPAARQFQRWTAAPLYLREYNVEVAYYRALARSTTSFARKVYYLIESLRFGYWEPAACRAAGDGRVIAVSDEDARDLSRTTGVRVSAITPFVQREPLPIAPLPSAPNVLVAGNLFMPNNVAALEWFLTKVWPLVEKDVAAQLVVAGSSPSDAVRELTAGRPRITLAADVPSMAPLYASARLCVNAAQTGSGVNMRSIEALQSGRPLVSTTTGAAGLPPGAALVANDPRDFADHVLAVLRSDAAAAEVQRAQRAAAAPLLDTAAKTVRLLDILTPRSPS